MVWGATGNILPVYSHHHRVLGHRPDHHRIGTNASVRTNGDGSQDLGTCTHHHPVIECWVAFSLSKLGTAQCHPVVQGDIFSNFRSLTNDNTHAVVNEQALSDGRTRVDLN